MRIRFWGTRGSIAKPGPSTIRYGGNTSCVELRTDNGTLIVFDCGTGAHELGRELMRLHGGATHGHILISHTHWDHIQGIPFFEPLFGAGGEWDIYGPKGLQQSMRDTLAGQMEYTYFPVSVDRFGATIRYHDLVEGAFNIDDVHISTHYLNHPALTLGYRLQVDGATMIYCCDHEPYSVAAGSGEHEIVGQDLQHMEFLAGADLVVHDAQFTAQEYPQRIGWGHSPLEYAVKVCQAAGVGQLLVTHHDPLRDDAELDRIITSLRQRLTASHSPLEVHAAAEGQVVQIAPSRKSAQAARSESYAAQATNDAVSLKRPILLRVTDPRIGGVLREAMRLEGLAEPVVPQDLAQSADPLTDGYSLALIQHDPPQVEGLDFARRIVRQMPPDSTQALPVVLVTADPELPLRHGTEAMDWLVAPFSLSYARTKLRYWTLRLACRWVRAQVPVDETQRLSALNELALLDTPPEERFDRITRLAAARFDVPVALISLVDRDRQWFKSCVGTGLRETSREVAFCAHAVEQRADIVVEDTLLDDRFADNPLVTSSPRIRFYAGAPLLLSNGICLGTLCVVDTRPRHLSDADLASLHDLRDMVLEQLATRRHTAA